MQECKQGALIEYQDKILNSLSWMTRSGYRLLVATYKPKPARPTKPRDYCPTYYYLNLHPFTDKRCDFIKL